MTALRTQRLNGRTARPIDLTEMGFGGAPLGNLYRKVSEEDAQAALQAAYDNGIRYFDTAPQYGLGRSEMRLPLPSSVLAARTFSFPPRSAACCWIASRTR